MMIIIIIIIIIIISILKKWEKTNKAYSSMPHSSQIDEYCFLQTEFPLSYRWSIKKQTTGQASKPIRENKINKQHTNNLCE